MRETWAVVLVAGLVMATGTAAAIPQKDLECPVEVDDGDVPDEPGEQLADVVGAQQSVVVDELEQRGFNATLANASSPEERATVVAAELERIDIQLAEIEACQAALESAREDGDLTATAYDERATSLEPHATAVADRLDRAEEVAVDLPSEVREEYEVDEERFDALWTRQGDVESFVIDPERHLASDDDREEVDASEPPATETATPEPEPSETTETPEPEEPTEVTTPSDPTDSPETDEPTPTPEPESTPEEDDGPDSPEDDSDDDSDDESSGRAPL